MNDAFQNVDLHMQEDNECADLAILQLVSMRHTVPRIRMGKE